MVARRRRHAGHGAHLEPVGLPVRQPVYRVAGRAAAGVHPGCGGEAGLGRRRAVLPACHLGCGAIQHPGIARRGPGQIDPAGDAARIVGCEIHRCAGGSVVVGDGDRHGALVYLRVRAKPLAAGFRDRSATRQTRAAAGVAEAHREGFITLGHRILLDDNGRRVGGALGLHHQVTVERRVVAAGFGRGARRCVGAGVDPHPNIPVARYPGRPGQPYTQLPLALRHAQSRRKRHP